MEGEVTQWDASSVLFTRNQHYGHVYHAHSLSCGWERRSLPSTHPVTFPPPPKITTNYGYVYENEKIYETLQENGKSLPNLLFEGNHGHLEVDVGTK